MTRRASPFDDLICGGRAADRLLKRARGDLLGGDLASSLAKRESTLAGASIGHLASSRVGGGIDGVLRDLVGPNVALGGSAGSIGGRRYREFGGLLGGGIASSLALQETGLASAAAGRTAKGVIAAERAAAGVDGLVRRLIGSNDTLANTAWGILARQDLLSGIVDAVGGPGRLEALRRHQWSSGIARRAADFATLMPNLSMQFGAVETARRMAEAGTGSGYGVDAVRYRAAERYATGLRETLAATSLKMSMLAGVADASGIRSAPYSAAVRDLIGVYRSRPDLPPGFWRDRRVRERAYVKADVDPGVVAAPPSVVVDIMVDSGLATGIDTDEGAVAFVSVGGVVAAIRSTDVQADAYRVIYAFEQGLRALIANALEKHVGPRWLRQRVDGKVYGKAKERSEDAMKSGEPAAPLIDFLELGELKDVVARKDSWEGVFEAVFCDRAKFEQNMLTVMALRRPVAHGRPIDGPRLLEAMIVMSQMERRMTSTEGCRLSDEPI